MKDDEERENNVKRNNYLLVMKLGKRKSSYEQRECSMKIFTTHPKQKYFLSQSKYVMRLNHWLGHSACQAKTITRNALANDIPSSML
ncbi:hypothetical protein MTR_3g050760 [Medicago truncatula]|uniref:Uncharacterized protein n=1 Tax=Medicago truncatula TaxID=3880 RepID=G7J1Z3_MEDTR|nr:hypothetical protein MTR_3g050760 [Medicago truncatula]